MKQNYLSSFTDKINKIENALESSDIQVLSTLIHQLIGSSGSYGFTTISTLCIEIEAQLLNLSSTDNPKLQTDVKRLTQLMHEARPKAQT
ncbi:Hpt domain-containing protein [Marinicella litoralis]|uniref:Hpt domain-containing protein n=1 Tax=Marinicella litoralis TaxID=644220 RepID=UPI003CCC4DF2